MNHPGEPTFQALCKLQNMIECGDFKRSQKIIEQHLKTHPKADCILYRCLNAMCLSRMGRADEAMMSAEAVLERFPVIRDTSALSALSVVFRTANRVDKIRDVYKSAWDACPNDQNIAESYALALAVCQSYGDLQKVATVLYKTSQNPLHQLWSIVGNIMQNDQPMLKTLALRMLCKLALDGKFSDLSIVQRQEVALLYLFGFGQNASFPHVVANFFAEDAGMGLVKALKLSPTWALLMILDRFIERNEQNPNSDCIAQHLIKFLLSDDATAASGQEALSIDPRENWSYYQVYIDVIERAMAHGTDLQGFESLEDKVKQVLAKMGVPPIAAQSVQKALEDFKEMVMRVTKPSTRTRDLCLLHVLRLERGAKSETMVAALAAFVESWATKNAWVTYLDIKPFLSAEIAERLSETAALAPYSALRGQLLIFAGNGAVPEDKAVALAADILQKHPKSTHNSATVAQLLCIAGRPLTAYASLEWAQHQMEPCSVNVMHRVLIASSIHSLNGQNAVADLALRNIQLETMHFLVYDGLRSGYHVQETQQESQRAVSFYNQSLKHDLHDILGSTFMNGTWNVLTSQLEETTTRLANSLHRCEVVVHGMLAYLEGLSGNKCAGGLDECDRLGGDDLDNVIALLSKAKEDSAILRVNDNVDVLEKAVWNGTGLATATVKRTTAERIAALVPVAILLRKLMDDEVLTDIDALYPAQPKSVASLDDVVDVLSCRGTLASTILHSSENRDKAMMQQLCARYELDLQAAADYLKDVATANISIQALYGDKAGCIEETFAALLGTSHCNSCTKALNATLTRNVGKMAQKVKQRLTELVAIKKAL